MMKRMMKKSLLMTIFAFVLLSISISQGQDFQRIVILHTNDIHGGIDPSGATYMSREFPPALGGGASAVRYIEQQRRRAEEHGWGFLLVDSGDWFQGTPIGTKSKGRTVMEYMNRVGYDVSTVGNHDFDEGADNLKELIDMAKFPVLGANVVNTETREIWGGLKPYIIKEVGEITVGIIGLCTTDTKDMSFPDNIKGVDFLPIAPVMEEYVKEVREKGVDLVMGLVHLGIPYGAEDAYERMVEKEPRQWRLNAMELAHQVPGIDVLVCGHIHLGYSFGWEEPTNHTLLVQTYGRGSGIGHVELLVDRTARTMAGYEFPQCDYGGLVTLFEDEFWPEEKETKVISAQVAKAEEGMDEPIGMTEVHITRGDASNNLMGFVVADAMREALNGDFAFTNLGGIRDEIKSGPIAPRDVFKVLPFGNSMVALSIPGSFLKKVVEIRVSEEHQGLITSGGVVVYSHSRPDMDRITTFEIGGKPLDMDRIYRVITTDFIAQGNIGLGILTTIPDEDVYYSGMEVRQAVMDYFRKHSPVAPHVDGRWTRDDGAEMSPELKKAMDELTKEAVP